MNHFEKYPIIEIQRSTGNGFAWAESEMMAVFVSSVVSAERVMVNPLRAEFFRGNINICLYFVSFLHIDTTQVVEILPQISQEPAYSI